METKLCGKCRQEKPVSEFYKSKRDGYRSRCKSCHREDNLEYAKTGYYSEYGKEYFKRPDVKRRAADRIKKYSQDPQKRFKFLARWYAKRMIRNGVITREPCAECGAEQAEVHHKDYNQPLAIVWLCFKCHRKLHLQVSEGEE